MVIEDTTRGVDTGQDAQEALLTRIRLRVRRRLLWMRSCWTDGAETRAWAIPESEVERILSGPEEAAAEEERFYRTDDDARHLSELVDEADLAFATCQEWAKAVRLFGLSPLESELLGLLIAMRLDPQLTRVYAYLNDDATAGHATPWLASRLFGIRCEPLGSQSPLVRWRLAAPVPGAAASGPTTPWTVDPEWQIWLLGHGRPDWQPDAAVQMPGFGERATNSCLHPGVLDEMLGFVHSVSPAEGSGLGAGCAPVLMTLVGPRGSGKRTLATQCAGELQVELITVDAKALWAGASPSEAEDRLIRVQRLALLTGAAVYWSLADPATAEIWQRASGCAGLTLLGIETEDAVSYDELSVHRTFHLPELNREQRLAFWSWLSDSQTPGPVEDWILTPAEIKAAARVIEAGTAAVAEACQKTLDGPAGELLVPVSSSFTWNDLVVPEQTREHLAELEAQVKLRSQVYEDWGFARLTASGPGTTAMFAGPSGTGKTMAAQVLARSLGIRLYRVDLAGVMNKYIGETEKRLKRVFDLCERANVLLFFDEADALFGRRMQAKDAHDRFANIQVDYLLQRMEQFRGLAILATNRKADLDQAFLRRIRFIVDFHHPGPAERKALWLRALPERTPSGEPLLEEIRWETLAQRLDLTGADIAAAALNAAFLARSEGTRIGMKHVLHAARREMGKHGVTLRWTDWEKEP